MKLVSDTQLAQIDAHLGEVLDRLLDAEGLAAMKRVIRAYVLAGGKRIRPQLCLWTYGRVGGSGTRVREKSDGTEHTRREFAGKPQPRTSNPKPLLDAACAWELFHAFLLAHDDIIDSAETRREQAALHRQLAALDHNCPKFGTNLGIVAGDLLFSAAMRLWHDLEAPAEQYRDLLKLFSRVATITGFGQAIDICQSHAPLDLVDEGTLLREYHWKTAAYTFEGPMLSGAILAGADAATQRAISAYALALGQAYQLQNDLLDLAGDVHEGCDIVQGKRTIGLVAARLQMDHGRRGEFDRKLADLQNANGCLLQLADDVRRDLLESGAEQRTREKVECFLNEAQAVAQSEALPQCLRDGMITLLESLQRQYFQATTSS